jgi:Domain of unknown function (DUF4333)
MGRRLAAQLLLALTPLAGWASWAGCSSAKLGHTLDTAGAARQIARNLSRATRLPAPHVHCPRHVDVAVGATFDCTTSLADQPVVVHAVLTDDRGRFQITPGAAIVIVSRAAGAIKAQVERAQAGAPSTVDCGPRPVLVKAPGATFSCTATAGGVSRAITVTVTDLNGDVTFEQSAPPSGAPPPGPAPSGRGSKGTPSSGAPSKGSGSTP